MKSVDNFRATKYLPSESLDKLSTICLYGSDNMAQPERKIKPKLRALNYAKKAGSFSKTSKLELPSIFPVCGGGLQLEWKYGKRDLEMEFNEETISVLKTEELSADEIMYLEKDNVSNDEIPDLIRWIENL